MINFQVIKRKSNGKNEHALLADLGGNSQWCLFVWDKQPTIKQVDDQVFYIKRTIRFTENYVIINTIPVDEYTINYN